MPSSARAFGLPGFQISSTEELLPTLQRALALDEPSLVAVPVDYGENLKLSERLSQSR